MFDNVAAFATMFGAPVASLLLIISYHLYLRRQLRRDPNYTIQAINTAARNAWVANIMRSGQPDVLPVQTLRNSTMAATFLASTAILLMMGVLSLTGHSGDSGSLFHVVPVQPDAATRVLWRIKLLALLADFFVAFLSFTLAIRMYNHVGYLINTPGHPPAYVARLLNRAGWYYSAGMRSYYFSVPLVFWLFGAIFMLAASLGMVVVFYHVDRAPKGPDDEWAPRVAPASGHGGRHRATVVSTATGGKTASG